jgi:hypothetical protein
MTESKTEMKIRTILLIACLVVVSRLELRVLPLFDFFLSKETGVGSREFYGAVGECV